MKKKTVQFRYAVIDGVEGYGTYINGELDKWFAAKIIDDVAFLPLDLMCHLNSLQRLGYILDLDF